VVQGEEGVVKVFDPKIKVKKNRDMAVVMILIQEIAVALPMHISAAMLLHVTRWYAFVLIIFLLFYQIVYYFNNTQFEVRHTHSAVCVYCTCSVLPCSVLPVLAQSYLASLLKLYAHLQMQSNYFVLIDFASLIVANSSNYIIFVPILIYSVFFFLIVYLLYYATYYGEINDYNNIVNCYSRY